MRAERWPITQLAPVTTTIAAPNHKALSATQASMFGTVCVVTPRPAVIRLTPETASAITRGAMRAV